MIRQLLLSVALPAVLGAIALVVAWRPWRRAVADAAEHRGAPVALGAAFLAAFVAEAGLPALPPAERWHAIALLAAAAAIVGVLVDALRSRLCLMPAGAAVVAIAASLVDLPGLEPPLPWRLGLVGAVVATAFFLHPIARRRRGASLPLAAMIAATTASIVLMEARFAKLAVVAGALAATLGVALVLAWISPRLCLAGGGVIVIAAILPTLMLAGHAYDYGDVPVPCFILPAAAPLALWIGEAPWVARRRPFVAVALRGLLVLVPCAIALGLLLVRDDGASDGYGGYGLGPAASTVAVASR